MDPRGAIHFREMLPPGRALSGIVAADGQMGQVMKAYLDWKLNGDTAWLKTLTDSQRASPISALLAPPKATIRSRARIDARRALEIEAVVQHDVIAFLTAVAEHVGPDARYIHLGLTSSDVLDTALACRWSRRATCCWPGSTACSRG